MDIEPQDDDLLPEEIEQLEALQKAQLTEKIEALGRAIAGKRKAAVDGRSGSGIEDEWREAEDAYLGVDDANRATTGGVKPLHPSGTPTFERGATNEGRATLLLNITRPYTDAASARVGDMLLPTDDRNWALKPTPIAQQQQLPPASPTGQPVTGAVPLPPAPNGPPLAAPGMVAAQPGMPQPASAMLLDADDQAEQVSVAARRAAAKAQKQIEDWHIECGYHAEMRKVIENCSRLGTGILKGPFPTKKTRIKSIQSPEGQTLAMIETINPASRSINPWNFYPDPSCGENIHDGQYVFERDDITGRKLRDLIGVPGYLTEQIEEILIEGPGCKYKENGIPHHQVKPDDDGFEIWYYYGFLEKEDLEAAGVDLGEDADALITLPAIVTLVNDRAICIVLNPLDSGEFPYDIMPWQRRPGFWAGVGVPKQIQPAQRMITAANRNMLDNAGISGGPLIGIRMGAVEPADGKWTLSPRKHYFVKADADVRSIREAIDAIIIPSNQVEMLNIINFGLKVAEDITGLPLIMQGQQGSAPDTVGGMQMVNNNASTVLRRIARNYDDCITEPHIRRYYQYLLMYGEDDSAKGDFMIDARGSTALVERELQNQSIMQMGNMVMNPVFEISPKKWMEEWLKSQRLDPERFRMSQEERQAVSQRPPPEAPQVTVAKIRAQTDQLRIKTDMDRDVVYAKAEADRTRIEAMSRREELMLKRELAYVQLQIQKGINVDDNKVRLAETAAKLRTQKELTLIGMQKDLHMYHNPTPQVLPPPAEPAWRAPPGQAFAR